ncbi:hypothetical protein IFM89_016290 [Coptis chinensis]|uniref:RING-type domain-containing protein n=1 Tax=Coptis chinensis TaxID=261450 RepID=A0A835H8W6_9MAGN|nr:hypothetical protein IFM89_016290 [Coptis chinensis]
MDDSCAVCAESLEWVAYGACGHREVCSTCVSRLRFICGDLKCCICKTESQSVFVTKALGDYTRTISDFNVFPTNGSEGQNGSYWYHEDTGAFFDDADHYRMIKAMCRLSCSVCDKIDEKRGIGNEGSISINNKRRVKYRNIEQLKSHIFHKHQLVMCGLCLEGRKIFICEQKLYTKKQLRQHISTGDSEMHFRSSHFLCENEACLAKKFTVFTSESEMKRHNALEHGGNMSRSKRNAVLQIPTSFRYRRSEQDHRRGRGRGYPSDSSEDQLSLAVRASLETSTSDNTSHDQSFQPRLVLDHREMSEIDELVPPFESLATTDSEASSRYLQAVAQSSRNVTLQESFFPPLPVAATSTQQKPKNEGLAKSTMATRLRKNGKVNVLNSPKGWSTTNNGLALSSSSYSQARSAVNHGIVASSVSASSPLTKTANGSTSSSYASTAQVRPTAGSGSSSWNTGSNAQSRATTNPGPVFPSVSASSPLTNTAVTNGPNSSSYASTAQARPATGQGLPSASSGSYMGSTARVSHSVSAPNLVQRGSLDTSMSDFPPVSATQKNKSPTSSQLKVENVQTANKDLVTRIKTALEDDKSKYTAFKSISLEYRLGEIGTAEYLAYVQQFGLTHLVPELARLCPDDQKQRELLETYNASVLYDSTRENGLISSGLRLKGSKSSNKGKGKCVEDTDSGSKEKLADNFMSTVKKLQPSYRPAEEEVEVLTKDGYRRSSGNSKTPVTVEQLEPSSSNLSKSNGAGVGSSISLGGGGSKPRKKTSKFHRLRLGEEYDPQYDGVPGQEETPQLTEDLEGQAVRGVWRNGGGLRLVAQTLKDPAK